MLFGSLIALLVCPQMAAAAAPTYSVTASSMGRWSMPAEWWMLWPGKHPCCRH
jgi:hypothetical protein